MVRSLDDWQSRGDYGAGTVHMVTASASIGGTRTGPPLRLVVPDHTGPGTGERPVAGGQAAAGAVVDHRDGAQRPAHQHARKSRWHRFCLRHQRQTGGNVDEYAAIVEQQIERSNHVFEVMGQDRVMLSDLMGD